MQGLYGAFSGSIVIEGLLKLPPLSMIGSFSE